MDVFTHTSSVLVARSHFYVELYTDAAFLDLKDNVQVKICVDVSLTDMSKLEIMTEKTGLQTVHHFISQNSLVSQVIHL